MKKLFKNSGGFTLVELMITVNIVGILSAMSMYTSLTYLERARESTTRNNLRILRDAITICEVIPITFTPVDNTGTVKWPTEPRPDVTYAVGTGMRPGGLPFVRKLPRNLIDGEDFNKSGYYVISFYDAPDTTFSFTQNFDGWHYYYMLNGQEVGLTYVPRSDTDSHGVPFSQW